MTQTRSLGRCCRRWSSTLSASDARLRDWIAQSHGVSLLDEDIVSVNRMRGMRVTLPPWSLPAGILIREGTPVPPFWHLALFPPFYSEDQLQGDGTESPEHSPSRPSGDYERMWASGAVEWAAENPLRIGQAIQQRTTIDSVVESPGGKSGRPAVFVTQRREIANDRGVCLVEKRCHVYRAPSTASPPPLPPPSSLPAATFGETYTPSPISLFRFSAITQNAHRIHYDHVYATQVERRDGCLTHGPMTALLLASLAAANHGPRPLTRFDYRATSPIVVGREVSYAGRRAGEGMELWAACGGVQAMRATAS